VPKTYSSTTLLFSGHDGISLNTQHNDFKPFFIFLTQQTNCDHLNEL